jgi:hypothetical protein
MATARSRWSTPRLGRLILDLTEALVGQAQVPARLNVARERGVELLADPQALLVALAGEGEVGLLQRDVANLLQRRGPAAAHADVFRQRAAGLGPGGPGPD